MIMAMSLAVWNKKRTAFVVAGLGFQLRPVKAASREQDLQRYIAMNSFDQPIPVEMLVKPGSDSLDLVAARHSVQRISKAAPFAIVGGITGGAVGLVNKNLGQAVGGISYGIGSVVLAPYSRSQEREADEVGIEMAASAGWDPHAMPSVLHTLQRDVELLQGGRESRASWTRTLRPRNVLKIQRSTRRS